MPPFPPSPTQAPPPQSPQNAGADPAQANASGGANPVSKATGYSGPQITCSACQYFQAPNSCSMPDVVSDPEVNGTVDPNGRCDLFAPGQGTPVAAQPPSTINSSLNAGPPSGFNGIASKPPSKNIRPMGNPSSM